MYGILLVLFRCCFHHIVENSILYKNDIHHFYIGPIRFSENKIIWSVVGRKVDVQILEWETENFIWCQGWETYNLFGAKWQLQKILFGCQMVNGAPKTHRTRQRRVTEEALISKAPVPLKWGKHSRIYYPDATLKHY